MTYAAGRVGQAFNFDGTGAVTVSSSSGLVSNQFTVDAWVYPTLYDGVSFGFGVNRVITRNGSYDLSIRNNGNFYYYITGVNGLNNEGGGRAYGGGPVPLNQWTHLALTYDGSRVRSYINGRIARTITGVTGNVTDALNPFIIGSDVGLNDTDKFDGRIDEVMYFGRALSETELSGIVNADSAGICPPPSAPPPSCVGPAANLISWYRTCLQ